MLHRQATTTGTFRVKALLLYLRERASEAQALAFAEQIGGGGIFENELRPLALTLWQRALVEFVRLAGEEALEALPGYLVHPENLGAWSRILRGADDASALALALGEPNDGLPGDPLWLSERQGPHSFILRAVVGDAPEPERRYMARALDAELRALPLLYGGPLGSTTVLEPTDPQGLRFGLTVHQAGHGAALNGFFLGTFALGAAWLASSLALFGVTAHSDRIRWGGALVLCLSTAWGAMSQRDARQRAHSRAQRVRIEALEREAMLNRHRSKEISRPNEEPVIAGQYRVGRQLGVGASGAVWEATRLTDGIQVALKLLRTAVVHDVRATDRLRREAEALGLSWHPNVVEVLDTGILSSGVGFLVMERLYGETLAERLHVRGHLGLEETRKLALQAADALFAVHSAGVIHRDIKPENLFLAQDADGQEVVKLIDFGVARVSWAETRLTRSGVRVGTPGYASPEQEAGAEIDGRTDLYGLGVCLLECLTGRGPLGQRPDRAPASAMVVKSDWSALLSKLMAEDPAHRHANARELREALLALAPAGVEQNLAGLAGVVGTALTSIA